MLWNLEFSLWNVVELLWNFRKMLLKCCSIVVLKTQLFIPYCNKSGQSNTNNNAGKC